MVCVFIAWFITACCPRCFWSSQVSLQAWKASVCRQAQAGAPSLWDLMLDDLRWSWCKNNGIKCTISVMCLSHPETIPTRSMEKLSSMKLIPWCQKGWGPLHSDRRTASHSTSKTSFQGEGGSLMKWNGEEVWESDLSPDWSITIYQACPWAPALTPSLSLFLDNIKYIDVYVCVFLSIVASTILR